MCTRVTKTQWEHGVPERRGGPAEVGSSVFTLLEVSDVGDEKGVQKGTEKRGVKCGPAEPGSRRERWGSGHPRVAESDVSRRQGSHLRPRGGCELRPGVEGGTGGPCGVQAGASLMFP